MAALEELTPGSAVLGVVPAEPVTVVAVQWFGSTALELTYRVESSGKTDARLLYRADEPTLRVAAKGRAWAFDADGRLFKLASEALRIRNAALFDPQLAVSVAQIEPLPHQLAAVYEEMLLRQPLRYLLADDPGAGKTIMAGLLIKELMLRGDIERCLICAPASLAEQWQDELEEKFDLRFRIVGRSDIENAVGNPFEESSLVISRIDLLKQDENQARLAQVDWDLVIVDEAHKMSASYFGNEVKKTARYRLGELLGQHARNLLLLTATPHRGKEEDFQLFLALLDGDRFEGKFRDGVHQADVSDLMRRLMKEDLLDFDGKRLFPERKAYTVNYPLSREEAELYTAVTDYVREQMSAADALAADGSGEGKRRRTVVGFALTTLQRRLASSPEAIYQSIARRRKRLERTLAEEQARLRATADGGPLDLTYGLAARGLDENDLEEDLAEQREDETERLVDQASAARSVAELGAEIAELRRLEKLAAALIASGHDSKWVEMSRLLQDRAEMFDPDGQRRKLVVFTEHRDTLNYLAGRIRSLLGRPEAVEVIHGQMGREERRLAQAKFVNEPETLVLVATDAAGEGINLQRANLLINYDLPWNPNRLEQRFGRIHRFGQRQVCHCWNLVAHETREGQVFTRLLDKLEVERQALGGKVFDVLGSVFEGAALRDLLLDAIRYGDDPEVQRRLDERIGEVMSDAHYREVLEQYALAKGNLDETRLRGLRREMERAEQQRLVPHFIAAFFLEAFRTLGGTAVEREPGRWEIRNVPADIRRRDRQIGRGAPVLQRYERITFDKERRKLTGRPDAEFVAPGHPLLDAVIDLVLERYRALLRRGTVLVDPREGAGETARTLFYVQTEITDGTTTKSGDRHVIGRRLHFVEIDEPGEARGGAVAPYLDYRELADDELPALDALLQSPLAQTDVDGQARGYAVAELVPAYLDEVKTARDGLIRKTMAAVRDRLTKEITYWDGRAEDLEAQEKAGKQPRMNSARARERRDRLTARLQERMAALEQARQIAAQAPVIVGGALVVPIALLNRLLGRPAADDSVDVREVERLAMDAVMAAERRAGREPVDVSKLNVGYDIESVDVGGRLRLIEVKGRRADADTVTVTRNEMLVALNKRDCYYLAVVKVQDGVAAPPVYIADPIARMLAQDPVFGAVSMTLKLDRLIGMGAEASVSERGDAVPTANPG